MTEASSPRCGYVAIVGRPNVGKSTLLNHILGQKLAITSRKPQTTRHTMLGIKTEGNVQAIYVDTPGLHKQNDKALNRYMNKTASAALKDVDVVVFVVDRMRWTEEDQLVLERVQYVQGPVLIADLAEAENIPKKFLEAILLALKNNGILQSRKGKGGGYYLGMTITMWLVLQAANARQSTFLCTCCGCC